MAIYRKCDSTADIINGLVTVNGGVKTRTYDPTPHPASGNYSQHLASGDALVTFTTLDGRYKTGPSGWSH